MNEIYPIEQKSYSYLFFYILLIYILINVNEIYPIEQKSVYKFIYKTYNPGDIIDISVNMGDYNYKTNLVISYIKNNKIITCGHCLPKNTNLDFGKIIYTSGFDNPSEKYELGIIKINKNKSQYFQNIIDGYNVKLMNKNNKLPLNTKVFNFYNRNKIYGKIIGYDIDNLYDWYFDHQITKLSKPYYLIAGSHFIKDIKQSNYIKKKFGIKIDDNNVAKLTTSGYSGSPWLYKNKDNIFHIGIHIGKTIGVYKNKMYEIAYVKQI